MTPVWLIAALFATDTEAAKAPDTPVDAEATAESDAPAEPTPGELQDGSDPPPSTWDKKQAEQREKGEEVEESSWEDDLLKSLGALLLVVAIIYLLFRVGLAKFIGTAAFKSGKKLKVAERIQLDGRHAVLILELEGRRYLIGTGEQGIQVLARLDRDEPVSPDKSFKEALDESAAKDAKDTEPGGSDA